MCQFRFGSRLLGQRLALSNVALSAFAPLIAARIAAFTIALPIASAAAPAASSSSVVSARLFAFAVGFRREAYGVVVRWTFLPSRVLIFSVELIPQFDDWNVLDVVVLWLALHMLATAAPAPAAPTTPSRSALAMFGGQRFAKLGSHVALKIGFVRGAPGGIGLFEVIFVFKRRHRGLRPLGDRFGSFGGVHLLTAIDHKSLRRAHRFICGDGNRNGKPFFEAA